MSDSARLVIIGAGIVGCSAAYHLSRLGWREILVLDQGPLYETGGSTSHAPGILFGTNPSPTMARMAEYSARLFDGFEFEGEPCWYPVGSIEVATTPERQQEIRRRCNYSRGFGAEAEMLSPEQVAEMVPIIDPGAITGGFHRPGDGVARAWQCAGALAREATASGGAEFRGGTSVTDIEVRDGRVRAVVTDQGRVACEQVLLCTNIWGSVLSDRVPVTLPMMACAHQYALTEPLPELAGETGHCAMPALRHQDRAMYFKQQADRWCTGSYRHEPHIISPYEVGTDAYWDWVEEDFAVAIDDAIELFPPLRGRRYDSRVCGMFVFSVDGFPMMGPTAVPGFWVGVGIWVTHSGGAGKLIAEWMTSGAPEWDTREMDISRFFPHQQTREYIGARSWQNYAEVYDIVHPKQQMEKPRNLRVSPWHEQQRQLRAEFFVPAGWEVPQWYGANAGLVEEFGIPPRAGWEAEHWSPIEGGEHMCTRERAGLFDISPIAKFEVTGRGALGFLQRLAANDVDRPVGKVVYTSMLTASGGIRADLTVVRRSADNFWVLTGGATRMLDLAWLRRHAPEDGSVGIADVTSAYAALGLWGPRARDLMQEVAAGDLSHGGFPYYTARHLEIGSIPVYALRVSFVGELGWELYVPVEFGLRLWEAIWEAGSSWGLCAAGGGAFDSLRLEKGYRLWGSELHTEYDPYEAGLAWTTRPEKGEFLGREALRRRRDQAPRRRLCCMTLDNPDDVAMGREPVQDGERVLGYVTSAGMGFAVGRFILYAYLPSAYARSGTRVQVRYFDRVLPATVADEPLYDPGREKIS